MKLDELVCPCVVSIPDKVIKEKRHGDLTFDGVNIVIASVRKLAKDYYQATTYDPARKCAGVYALSLEAEYIVVENAALIKEMEENVLANLAQQLCHNEMTLGSDPEIFVVDKEEVVIPAFKFLSSKAEGTTRTAKVSYGNLPMYWDGFQAEFETSGQHCLAWQVDSVQAGLKSLIAKAREYDKDAKLSIMPTLNIPRAMLEAAAPEHVSFGCMPSLNVYGMEGVKLDGRTVPFRSAGGHIHFGVEAAPLSEAAAAPIVKALDAIIGVMCVSLFAKYDDPHRRILYGLAGEYRLPKHGLEYRVLSNVWLCHPLIMNLVFDIARKAFMFGKKGFMKHFKADEAEVIRVINECDVEGAQKIMEANKALLMGVISAAYGDNIHAAFIYNIFMKGLGSVIANPEDIAANWCCNDGQIYRTHSDGVGKNWLQSKQILGIGHKVS